MTKISWKEIFDDLTMPDIEKEFRELIEKEKYKIMREKLYPSPKQIPIVH